MSNGVNSSPARNWLESCSFVHIFRTFRLAISPSKLALALAALVLTWSWGTLLDVVWKSADRGVAPTAIQDHVAQVSSAVLGEDQGGEAGIFAVWSRHLGWCIESGLSSLRHGDIWGGGPDSVGLGRAGAVPSLASMFQGTTWLLTQHALYALLFFIVVLAVWAFFGGAICRMAAVKFARDEDVGWAEALKFAKDRFIGGFFLSPLLPVVMLLFIGLALAVGGAFLRIPYLGDILGSVLFFLAVLGGVGAALIVIGSIAGGSLFWPTIAAEGSESLDAISRSFHYVAASPWRALFYGLVATAYASLCFLLVQFVAFLALKATHAFVGFGTAPCGLWRVADGSMSKLDLLWRTPTFAELHPPAALPGGIESFSAVVLGMWVMLVVLLVWAFLASFYLSGSTVIYFLLRRVNDAMDLEEVYIESYEEGEFGAAAPAAETPAAAAPAAEEAEAAPAEAAPATPSGGGEPGGGETGAEDAGDGDSEAGDSDDQGDSAG